MNKAVSGRNPVKPPRAERRSKTVVAGWVLGALLFLLLGSSELRFPRLVCGPWLNMMLFSYQPYSKYSACCSKEDIDASPVISRIDSPQKNTIIGTYGP